MQLQTSKTLHCDVAIIGAGINGCLSAYVLHQRGLNVVLFDSDGIAAGGSGAAGAFIAPKISKDGPLKEIMEVAYRFALDFYTSHFPNQISILPLLHLAKDEEDVIKINSFKRTTTIPFDEIFEFQDVVHTSGVYFPESGIVNAQKICNELVKNIPFYQEKVEMLTAQENGKWNVNSFTADNVVLTIGAYPQLIETPYLQLRGIWGHRIDIQADVASPLSTLMHQWVSIAPISSEIYAIGATHNVHYKPWKDETYNPEEGRKELLEKANRTLKLNNIKIVKDYTGLRSGSNDYMPILGPLVDENQTLKIYPGLKNGMNVASKELSYYPNLIMMNGSGGYGFVLAPYLAHLLEKYICENEDIPEPLLPSRFFKRWIKRKKSK